MAVYIAQPRNPYPRSFEIPHYFDKTIFTLLLKPKSSVAAKLEALAKTSSQVGAGA